MDTRVRALAAVLGAFASVGLRLWHAGQVRRISIIVALVALAGCQSGTGAAIASAGGSATSLPTAGPSAIGPTTPPASGSPVGFASAPFSDIAAGSAHTCVIAAGGVVECWGANESGQLGNGSFNTSSTPAPVIGLGGQAIALRAGPNYTCAILAGGAVQCWGDDKVGQLGDGKNVNSPIPVDVVGLSSDVEALDTDDTGVSLYFDACALVRDVSGSIVTHTIKCWGNDGIANVTSPTPKTISGLAGDIVNIVAGADDVCALFRAGGVKCIGLSASLYYQDGIPRGLGSGIKAIDSGATNFCVISDAGGLKCWGDNTLGELGTGSSAGFGDQSTVPLDVVGLATGASRVSVGGTNACAITEAGGLKCWGDNQFGKLGNGVSTSGYSAAPVDVVGLATGVVGVAEGDVHACAITDGGSKVKCWGFNDRLEIGQRLVTPLGLGIQWSLVPVDVAGL